MFYPEIKVESAVLNENDNTIEVIKRQPSIGMLACNPPRPSPDAVWKEIYGVVDGKIQLIKEVRGTHVPAETIFKSEEFLFEE